METVPTKNLQRQGNGSQGTEQEKRPTDCSALVFVQAIGQQEADTGTQGGTSTGDQGQLR